MSEEGEESEIEEEQFNILVLNFYAFFNKQKRFVKHTFILS